MTIEEITNPADWGKYLDEHGASVLQPHTDAHTNEELMTRLIEHAGEQAGEIAVAAIGALATAMSHGEFCHLIRVGIQGVQQGRAILAAAQSGNNA